LIRRLTRKGYVVTEAADGHAALELIESQPFDLAVFDIMMPGLTGLNVLETVRKRHTPADFPIIMATAKTQSDDVVEALRLGANDYVTKPIDFPVLLARMQTHLNLKRLFKLKDEFLSIASHDLKNPLFVIVCQAYLIQNRVPPGAVMDNDAFNMIDKISLHAKTMQKIIADFLDFQAMEDGHIKLLKEPLDIPSMLMRTVENYRPHAAGKEIELSVDESASVPSVSADRNRVEQILQNLLNNAIKFTPKGGLVRLSTLLCGNDVRVEVSDNGPGLTDEDLTMVFQKYGRLSSKATGGEKSSGLGLAICKKMVELHAGVIGVDNHTDGPGATFWFTLPLEAVAV
jgi:two-component system, sensor histidine kinase and response regulator